jgi:hypothetical protein
VDRLFRDWWPYDIYSYVDVAPLLASAGYRVIVPCVNAGQSRRLLQPHHIRDDIAPIAALRHVRCISVGHARAMLMEVHPGAVGFPEKP